MTRGSKLERHTSALSLYTSQTEDGITILNPSLKLGRFTCDENGPFAELHKVIQEQHQDSEGPALISNLPNFEQVAQNLVSHNRKAPSADLCNSPNQNKITDIHSLSCMLII